MGYPVDETQDGYLRNTLTSEMVRSGEDVKPPARIEADQAALPAGSDGVKESPDYPEFMQQIERVAIAADER